MNELILGSKSKRRIEILRFFNLPFSVIPSSFDEKTIPHINENPSSYTLLLAKGKAEAIQKEFPKSTILTADTIVFLNDKIYGKPKSTEEGLAFLKELSGKWHEVITGVCVTKEGQYWTESEMTKVLFNPLSDLQIKRYQQHIGTEDKAGGYAIQRNGSLIVSKIEGCYYNAMGLPINTTLKLLQKAHIDLWDFIQS